MESKLIISALFSLSLLVFNANATGPPEEPAQPGGAPGQGPCIKDITKYGAVPGADIAPALLCAWKEAIASPTPVQILIPPGTWQLLQVEMCGPSRAPIELNVQGTVEANPDPAALPNKKAEWFSINYMCNLTIFGGGVFDGKGEQAWKQNDCNTNKQCTNLPKNFSFNFINNTVIKDITTKDSKNFHVNLIASNNVTFQRFHVSAPGESINTDGIHIGWSNDITVIDSIIETGDDCVSLGDKSCNLRIQNVTCGPGHGVSIGSLGRHEREKDVNGVFVQNCTFKGTQNGVRIKTWPSPEATLTIQNVSFTDLIMENVTNPIVIDQEYCPWNQCDKTKHSMVKICDVTINNVKGTCNCADSVILVCSGAKPCENVKVGDIDLTYIGDPSYGPIKTKCCNIQPIITGKTNPPLCAPAPPSQHDLLAAKSKR